MKRISLIAEHIDSLPVAWCVELGRLVYAHEIPSLQARLDQDFTFRCPECHESLLFYFQCNGIRAQTGFVAESVIDPRISLKNIKTHRECLKKLLAQNCFPEEFFIFQDFERAFTRVEDLLQDLHTALMYLEETFYPLQSHVFLKGSSRDLKSHKKSLLEEIEKNLEHTRKSLDHCYLYINHLEKAYKTLRQKIRRF